MPVTIPANLLAAANDPSPTSPFLWLWELEIERNQPPTPSTALRIVRSEQPVVLDAARTFWPFPVSQSALEMNSSGDLPQITLQLANHTGVLMPYLDRLGGCMENRAYCWLVYREHIAVEDSMALRFRIASVEATIEAVQIRLEVQNPFLRTIPRDRYDPRRCRHAFGGSKCGYLINTAAAYTTCPGTIPACIARGDDEAARRIPRMHPRNFGGFRGVAVSRRR